MAVHKLKIVVVSGSGKSDGTLPTKENRKSALYKALNYNDTIKSKVKQSVSPGTYFAIQSGVNLAVQTGREMINYYVSDIGRRNGDSNYQTMVNRKIEKATDVLSLGQGALGGAAAGSAFGLAGAAIGAAIGVASAGISLGFKYAERERTYQHEMFKENNSQAYNLARANYSALTGRVR